MRSFMNGVAAHHHFSTLLIPIILKFQQYQMPDDQLSPLDIFTVS